MFRTNFSSQIDILLKVVNFKRKATVLIGDVSEGSIELYVFYLNAKNFQRLDQI